MIGLDTNVLVRYIMQDDPKQTPLATRLVESLSIQERGFIPLIAVAELTWVLASAYDLDRNQLVAAFESILRTKELSVERAETVWRALRTFKVSTADFADCLIAASATAAGCEKTVTFDRAAAKSGGMTLLT